MWVGHQPSHKAGHKQQMRKCLRYYLGFLFQCAESLIKNCMCLQVKHFFINPLSVLFAHSIFKPKLTVIVNLGWVLGVEIKT